MNAEDYIASIKNPLLVIRILEYIYAEIVQCTNFSSILGHVNLTVKYNHGNTILHILSAIPKVNIHLIKYLKYSNIVHTAHLNALNNVKVSCLDYAFMVNNIALIRFYSENGALFSKEISFTDITFNNIAAIFESKNYDNIRYVHVIFYFRKFFCFSLTYFIVFFPLQNTRNYSSTLLCEKYKEYGFTSHFT